MEGLIAVTLLAVVGVPVLLVVALVWIAGLRRRITLLEAAVGVLQYAQSQSALRDAAPSAVAQRAAAPSDLPRTVRAVDTAPTPQRAPVTPPDGPVPLPPASIRPDTAEITNPDNPPPSPASGSRAVFEIGPGRDRPSATGAPPPPLPPRPVRPPRPPRQPPAFIEVIRRWFTEGNVPVKVGVLVLFAGVAALLKYAADAGWVRLPIEARLAAVALGAIGALVLGWRKRASNRTFALSVQGGAIGVLLLVVFAAFKLYALMPATAAFALSVAFVAGACVLAVRQDSLALAVFGVLAGFLAPLWLSTGSGNHVALFGYYAVLNAGIFAIAWWRAWRVLNLLGFVFTFGIGALWGASAYTPQHYATTQPFLALFFALYLLIPILNARRAASTRPDAIDGTLVFGTPLAAFALQAALLRGEAMPLAFCALGLGALYAVLAAVMRRHESMQSLVAPFAMLAIAFATLAIPLALSAQATACAFAVEGAALVWLGLRQKRWLPQAVGVLLQGAAAVSFTFAGFAPEEGAVGVLNARFAAALLISVSGFASALWFRRAGHRGLALAFYLWAMGWWLLATLDDVSRFVADDLQLSVAWIVGLATAAVAVEAHARLQPSRALAWTFASAMLLGVPIAWGATIEHGHPFAHAGWIAWLVYVLAGLRGLQRLRDVDDAPVGLALGAWWVSLAVAFSLFLRWTADTAGLGSGWEWAGVALPWLALLAAIDTAQRVIAGPVGVRFETVHRPLRALLAGIVALGASIALFDRGDASPAAWIAVFNPLDLVQLLALGLLARIVLHGDPVARHRRLPWIGLGAFALVTAITLRATHHWGDVAWSIDMVDSSLVQTALSIVWSVLGVIGWVVGSRRGQRGLWIGGAVLMAVVLAKLVVVDRTHLGNLLGIASFLAYGLLCVAVGYFAPAPPRRADPVPEPA